MEISDDTFADMIAAAMGELPEKYIRNLTNVAIVYEEEPNAEQRKKLALKGDQTLFGLYEGIPRTNRGAGYNLVLPDKITIFRGPLVASSRDETELKAHIKHTLWHEIAHHYGLNHDHIRKIEQRFNQ